MAGRLISGASRFASRIPTSRALSTTGSPSVTLRYFDSRGRAQGNRYALIDAGVNFKDDRISLNNIITGNWFNMKANENISGPFGTLPVLHWDDFTMGQTEAIAGYLYHKLGHSDGMTLEDAAKSAALVSVSHQDIIILCLQVLNVVGTSPDIKQEQIGQAVHGCNARVNGFLPRIERLITPSGYFLKDAPVIADYHVFEALEQCKIVLGDTVLDQYPKLSAFVETMSSRPNIASYIAGGDRPLTLTGAPQEPSILEKIRDVPSLR